MVYKNALLLQQQWNAIGTNFFRFSVQIGPSDTLLASKMASCERSFLPSETRHKRYLHQASISVQRQLTCGKISSGMGIIFIKAARGSLAEQVSWNNKIWFQPFPPSAFDILTQRRRPSICSARAWICSALWIRSARASTRSTGPTKLCHRPYTPLTLCRSIRQFLHFSWRLPVATSNTYLTHPLQTQWNPP